jgi:hypothetical protein
MGQRLYVTFGGRSVVIDSESEAIIDGIRRRFRALEAGAAESNATRFVVEARESGSYVFRTGDARISCRSSGDLVERLSYEISLEVMEGRPDLLWLHAASAELGGYAVALAGASGSGKSTVVAGLCECGWSYMSDDITPLDPATGLLIPFALAPEIRRYSGKELSADGVRNLKKVEVSLQTSRVCPEPVPIGALIFPGYDPRGATRLVPCSPTEAATKVLSCCLNFVRHREAAVRYVCELVQKLPVFWLSFSSDRDAVALLGQVQAQWRTATQLRMSAIDPVPE